MENLPLVPVRSPGHRRCRDTRSLPDTSAVSAWLPPGPDRCGPLCLRLIQVLAYYTVCNLFFVYLFRYILMSPASPERFFHRDCKGRLPFAGVRGVPEKPFFSFLLAACGGERRKGSSGDTPDYLSPRQGPPAGGRQSPCTPRFLLFAGPW